MNAYLLPSGLRDLLPPQARRQTAILASLLQRFELFGYEQVIPPLMEFEETLLSGQGKAVEERTFRVLDPLSHQMMGIRADMTIQVARIAASRLADAPLPLRLAYTGNVLRVTQGKLAAERQLSQAGIELIGSNAPTATAETIIVALEALEKIGITQVVVDISATGLLDGLISEKDLDAIKTRDFSSFPPDSIIAQLSTCMGNINKKYELMRNIKLPELAADLLVKILRLAECVSNQFPHAILSFDPFEGINFEYHQGVCFSFYLPSIHEEIGRGGEYKLGDKNAVGVSLYVNRLLDIPTLKLAPPPKQITIPFTKMGAEAKKQRDAGVATLLGHD